MNKSQETTVFSGRQKFTSAMNLRPEKCWETSNLMLYKVSHHREPPDVRLIEKVSGNLYWWVELCVPSLIRELPHFLIMNKSQETTVFDGRQKLISAMKQRPEK